MFWIEMWTFHAAVPFAAGCLSAWLLQIHHTEKHSIKTRGKKEVCPSVPPFLPPSPPPPSPPLPTFALLHSTGLVSTPNLQQVPGEQSLQLAG